MVASRTIRCRVITVDVQNGDFPEKPNDASSAETNDTPRFRPSELLPWADPYIAGLVRKLQAEVREDVDSAKPQPPVERLGVPVADLEWPWEGDAELEPLELEPAGAPG